MSEKDLKKEEERKRRQEEFDRLMSRTSVTRPPSDRALLRRVTEISLEPSSAPVTHPIADPATKPLTANVTVLPAPENSAEPISGARVADSATADVGAQSETTSSEPSQAAPAPVRPLQS